MARSLSKGLQNLLKTGHLQGNNFHLPSSGVVKQVEMEISDTECAPYWQNDTDITKY